MDPRLIETDSRSRAVLTGHPNQRFLMHDQSDGSILLVPAQIISDAQYEYDTNPELQRLLADATDSSSVQREQRTA